MRSDKPIPEDHFEWYRTREFQLKYKRRFGKFPRDIADFNDRSSYESWEEFKFYLSYFPESWHEDRARRQHQKILDAMTPEKRAEYLKKEKESSDASDARYKKAMMKSTQTLAEAAEMHEEFPCTGRLFFRCFPELREKFYEMLEKEPNKCLKDLFSD